MVDDLGGGSLKNLHERQVRKSALMENALTLYQCDILGKKPRSYQEVWTVMNDILEHQQQNMLISQQERPKDRAAVYSLRGAEKSQDCRLLGVKRFVFKGRKLFF